MVNHGMLWNFILTWLVCVFLSHHKAPKYCFCVMYQNTILYCIVPLSCAINCDGYVNICDNWQYENLVMVFFHSRAVFTWLSKGIGFGFGFGFTTPFGWLVYLLWFWFYDSQVKTALIPGVTYSFKNVLSSSPATRSQ